MKKSISILSLGMVLGLALGIAIGMLASISMNEYFKYSHRITDENLFEVTAEQSSSTEETQEDTGEESFSLADIGTSKQEIAYLEMKVHEASAREYLEYLRNGTDFYDIFIWKIRHELKKGGLSLTDIGTSEREIAELRVKNLKLAAGYLEE